MKESASRRWEPTSSRSSRKRGSAFSYNRRERELADLCGVHLTAIPDGSFEDRTA
jgi:hypothetical protein